MNGGVRERSALVALIATGREEDRVSRRRAVRRRCLGSRLER
jgi:hypothetical protein